jgi:hypothetical protein
MIFNCEECKKRMGIFYKIFQGEMFPAQIYNSEENTIQHITFCSAECASRYCIKNNIKRLN